MSSTFVLAVKGLAGAKSRLAGAPAALRRRLVLAMALDVAVAAGQALDRVVVVGDDPEVVAAFADRPGVLVVPDPGGGLNAALARGAESVLARPDALVIAGVADLPGLRPEHLTRVGELARGPGRWFCPDISGRGTTLLAARGEALRPGFEGASAARHLASGATALTLDPRARHDVDTLAELALAVELGVGAHTAALAAEPELARLLRSAAPPPQGRRSAHAG